MSSSFGLDDRESAREFAKLFAEFEARLRALEMNNQLNGASLEGGTLEVYDDDGNLRTSIGTQYDGTVGIVHRNAPPPPTPTDPVVAPVLAGLLVTWDGRWADADSGPLDLVRVQVHLGATADFTPSSATVAATISNPAGATVTIATVGYATQYVRLVAVNVAEVTGTPSAAVAGTPRMVDGPDLSALLDLAVWLKDASVAGTKIVAGTIGANLLAANAVVAGKIDAGAVRAREIAAGAIEANHIQAGTIDATHIKAGAITGREIKALSVVSDQLAAGSVTAGKIAAGAVNATHLSVASVQPEQIAVGQGNNVIPDPSFESAAAANLVAAAGAPWSLAPGHRVGVGVQVECTAVKPSYFQLPLTRAPILPGTQFVLGVDILTSADLVAEAVKILVRWEDSHGAVLGYGAAETSTPLARQWQRITSQVIAPQGATQAALFVEVSAAVAGWVVFDNSECHPIFGRVTGGAHAEVGPNGLRLYDETGAEAVSLVTGTPQYLTLRNAGRSVASIDTDGAAGFTDLAVAGTLLVGGEPVGALLGNPPRGIVAVDYIATPRTSTGPEMGYVELAFEPEPDRMYRLVLECMADPTAAGPDLFLKFRNGGAASPTISSPLLYEKVTHLSSSGWQTVRMETLKYGRDFVPGGVANHILVTFAVSGGSVTLSGDNNRLGVFYIEDVGAAVPETGGYNDGGGSAARPVRTYTKTYPASWSASYAGRSGYNAYYRAQAMQGFYSAANGVQASLIGFPASLSADLAGAKVEKAEVYLYFDHWYYSAGGTAVIKTHAHATRPARFSADAAGKSVSWKRNEGKWVDITSMFDPARWRGIALDPNSTNRLYYGSARGATETYPPRLRVRYTK
ncbi:hypothetical protein ACIP93_33375 [Streptomyces sp. NPDC088745]|uniref:hypothetical protein n=1 Tax=Streptomyces sp. NPDC088745 TaxID=3365884 RepID=UPI00380C19C1